MRTSSNRAFGDSFKGERRCLGGCGKLFPSDGPWHRICPGCDPRNRRLSRREASRGCAARYEEPEKEDPPIFDQA